MKIHATKQKVVKLASYVIPETDFSSFMVVEKMPIRSCLQMEVKLNLISIIYIQLQQHVNSLY